MTTFFTTLGIVAGALISLGVLLNPLIKKIRRFGDWLERFMRDWEGEPAEPGRDAVPGVMERLNKLDGELTNNGGKSTKDIVDRLLKNQELLMEAFVEMGERLIAIETHLSKIEVTPQDSED